MNTTKEATILPFRPDAAEALLHRLQSEADAAARSSPELGLLLLHTVRHATSFEDAVARRVSQRLGTSDVPAEVLRDSFRRAFEADPQIAVALRADALAVLERDPATTRLLEPVLFYKGFHAIQTHRLAHWMWNERRHDLALYLQSRSSEVFQTDIHPAARFGRGIFLDHATGFVVGETASVADDVSILHSVTLGGTGKEHGDRHPKIGRGVLIGAGAKILGPITVGHCARVAAGSVVLAPVPPATTVAGVPAKTVGSSGCPEPFRNMDQTFPSGAVDPVI